MSQNATQSFQSIFKGLKGEEMVVVFKFLKLCNISAVINVIEEETNVWNILTNEEVLKCTSLIEAKDRISLSLNLFSKHEKITRFIREAGLSLNKNWQNSIYNFLTKCETEQVVVECINKNINDCPSGNVQYGTLTLGAILFPGILFAFSEFCYYMFFPFGGYMASRQLGKNWPLVLKCLAFPSYAIFMGIFLIVLTTLQ